MKLGSWMSAAAMLAACAGTPAFAQDGARLFGTYCAACHDGGDARAPSREMLGRMSAEQILDALEKGSMKAQSTERSRAQRHALAEYLSGKPLAGPLAVVPASAFCGGNGQPFRASLAGPAWNGWGAGLTNARAQS